MIVIVVGCHCLARVLSRDVTSHRARQTHHHHHYQKPGAHNCKKSQKMAIFASRFCLIFLDREISGNLPFFFFFLTSELRKKLSAINFLFRPAFSRSRLLFGRISRSRKTAAGFFKLPSINNALQATIHISTPTSECLAHHTSFGRDFTLSMRCRTWSMLSG